MQNRYNCYYFSVCREQNFIFNDRMSGELQTKDIVKYKKKIAIKSLHGTKTEFV